MKKIRLAIIGVGMAFEKLHYPALKELADKYQIVALCDVDKNKVETWGQRLGLKIQDLYTNYRQMLNRTDIDAYNILVPIELNFEVMETVAQTGKPIICEKPLAPNREEAERARDLPKKYNIPIMIAENYRYNEENDLIRDLVRTKEIGEVEYFIYNDVTDFAEQMHGNSFPSTEWRQHPEFPGGIILDYCVHNIAALHHIFGGVESVHAFARKMEGNYQYAPYSVVQANLQFENGVIGQFSFFNKGKEIQRPLVGLRIFGSKGMIYLEERDAGIINIFYNDGGHRMISYQPRRGYYNELLNFYKAATGEEQLSSTPEVEFGDAMTVFAILQSIQDKSTVEVKGELSLLQKIKRTLAQVF